MEERCMTLFVGNLPQARMDSVALLEQLCLGAQGLTAEEVEDYLGVSGHEGLAAFDGGKLVGYLLYWVNRKGEAAMIDRILTHPDGAEGRAAEVLRAEALRRLHVVKVFARVR
jgi:hypothetical protein